jgi:transposase InsO family protein
LEGIPVNHKKVERIMRGLGLKAVVRVVKYRSYKGEIGKVAPNLLERDFRAERPLRKLATDITQVKIGSEKTYVSPILDMYNGEIIACDVADSPNLEQTDRMLRNLFRIGGDALEGAVLHSDQGWQYQHVNFQKALAANHMIQSMSRKGNCLDNAMMESFFGAMKSELLYLEKYDSMAQFKSALKDYIRYYNNDRIKLRLKMSPVKYRLTHLSSFNNPSNF